MAYETTIANYESVIGVLPENTIDTPYEIVITDIKNLTVDNLKSAIISANRFVSIYWSHGVTCSLTDIEYMFDGCTTLVYVDMTPFKNAERLSFMFTGCSSLKEIDISLFDYNSIEAQYAFLFDGCISLKEITANIGTCNWLETLPSNDIETPLNVTITDIENLSAGYMDYRGPKSGNLGDSIINIKRYVNIKWKKDSIWTGTNAQYMFIYAEWLTGIDTSPFINVTNANLMFSGCNFTSIDLSPLTKVTEAERFISGNDRLKQVTYNIFTTPQVIIDQIPGNVEKIVDYGTTIANYVSNVSNLSMNDKDTPYDVVITDIEHLGTTNLRSAIESASRYVNIHWIEGVTYRSSYANSMFKSCSFLISVDTSPFNNVTNADSMFSGCYSLSSIDTSPFTNVTSAKSMFYECGSLSSIDTSPFNNVTNADSMFSGCRSLSSIDTSPFANVTNADSMFSRCSSLSSIDTSPFTNVTNANRMFSSCSRLKVLDMSNFTNITSATNIFDSCLRLESVNISSFGNIQDASGMFAQCEALKSVDISSLTMVTKTYQMFYNCFSLSSINVSHLSNVENATSMFAGGWGDSKTIEFITGITSSSVISAIPSAVRKLDHGSTIADFASKVSKFDENREDNPIDMWILDVGNLTNSNLKQAIDSGERYVNIHWIDDTLWSGTDASGMFYYTNIVEVDTEPFVNITLADNMFAECPVLTTVDTSSFTNVTSAESMFEHCASLTSIDTTPFVNLEYAMNMFKDTNRILSYDTSSFGKVKNASGMFENCFLARDIDATNFKSIESIQNMFSGCINLQSIDLSSFENVVSADGAFNNCVKLKELNVFPLTHVETYDGIANGTKASIYAMPGLNPEKFINYLVETYPTQVILGLVCTCETYKEVVSKLPVNTKDNPYKIIISDPENISGIYISE